MLQVKKERKPHTAPKIVKTETRCYHCGTPCITDRIAIEDKVFCCEGCKMVFEILNTNGLCDYYSIENHPGLSQVKPTRSDKFSYLDNEEIANKLYTFTDGTRAIVTLYLPGVHCSSCMWLIEHMFRDLYHCINHLFSHTRCESQCCNNRCECENMAGSSSSSSTT